MEGLPGQVSADFAAFTQSTPDEVGTAKRIAEQQEAMRKRDEAKLTPKQLESADKFAEQMKHEDEKNLKTEKLRRITDYARSFPDRIRAVNIKKLPTLKNTLEELEVCLNDIERDLGRTSSVDMLTIGYIQGMHIIEPLGPRFGVMTQHLGQVAVANERNIHDLMEEFCIKHDNWFSSSIEWRLAQFTAQMILKVHRANSEQARAMMQGATKPASDKMKEEAESL